MISNTYPKCFLYFLCFPKSQRILHRSIYCQIHQLVSTPLLTEINKESGICCEETKRHKMPSLQSLTNANRGGLAYVLVVYAYVKIAHLSKYHLLVRAKRVCLVREVFDCPSTFVRPTTQTTPNKWIAQLFKGLHTWHTLLFLIKNLSAFHNSHCMITSNTQHS